MPTPIPISVVSNSANHIKTIIKLAISEVFKCSHEPKMPHVHRHAGAEKGVDKKVSVEV